jgi:hypothetical protein
MTIGCEQDMPLADLKWRRVPSLVRRFGATPRLPDPGRAAPPDHRQACPRRPVARIRHDSAARLLRIEGWADPVPPFLAIG